MSRLCLILLLLFMLAAPAFPGQEEQAAGLAAIQRRVYTCSDEQAALRHGIDVLQTLGFSLEQAFPLENAVRLIKDNGLESEIFCGLKARKLPGQQNKAEIWLDLKNDPLDYRKTLTDRKIEAITDPRPYKTFFRAFEKSAGNELKGGLQ